MTQAIFSVAVFLALLAVLPLLLKWVKARAAGAVPAGASVSRLVSAIAVGPQQRVVTVEVGSRDSRVWLVLGVTAQSVSCLHCLPVPEAGSLAAIAPDPGP